MLTMTSTLSTSKNTVDNDLNLKKNEEGWLSDNDSDNYEDLQEQLRIIKKKIRYMEN